MMQLERPMAVEEHTEQARMDAGQSGHAHDNEHCHDRPHHHPGHTAYETGSLNKTAFMATVHCLTGCTIGEALGMVLGTGMGWGNWATVSLAVAVTMATRLPD
jgi:hypothetical protein